VRFVLQFLHAREGGYKAESGKEITTCNLSQIWLQGPKVEYSLRAIPLGGFVGFPDDGPQSEFKPDDPDLLQNRSIPGRFLVMSAGIIANCIFAFSILFVQVSYPIPPIPTHKIPLRSVNPPGEFLAMLRAPFSARPPVLLHSGG